LEEKYFGVMKVGWEIDLGRYGEVGMIGREVEVPKIGLVSEIRPF
jgi:hypothetical protein